MSRETAEFAYDLHSGLSSLTVSEFDELPQVGMAATLAVHIKGLPDIDYEVLRKVSDFYFSIPSYALKTVLAILEEVGFIRILSVGKTIEKIIPQIPAFNDVYQGIGEYIDKECNLNEHEDAILEILSRLYDAPCNRDSMLSKSGIDRGVFDRCVLLGAESGIVSRQFARGREILISPYYFADNLDGLADVVASGETPNLKSVLAKMKLNQGWPLSVVLATSEIGGTKISKTEAQLVEKLASEGIVKPPTIKFGTRSESFLFTPRPGQSRLNAANREIYERAMALLSAVRKGQLLADRYPIRSPILILEALRDRGSIGASSEAREQYQNLVSLRVGSIRQVSSAKWQFVLMKTEENMSALNLAIQMLRSGSIANMEINKDAKLALSRDDKYIQSLIGASELKKRRKQITDAEAVHEFDQLLMKFD